MVLNNNDDKIINHGEDKKRKMKHCLFWLDSGLKKQLWQIICIFCLFASAVDERTSRNNFRFCVFCGTFGLAVETKY